MKWLLFIPFYAALGAGVGDLIGRSFGNSPVGAGIGAAGAVTLGHFVVGLINTRGRRPQPAVLAPTIGPVVGGWITLRLITS